MATKLQVFVFVRVTTNAPLVRTSLVQITPYRDTYGTGVNVNEASDPVMIQTNAVVIRTLDVWVGSSRATASKRVTRSQLWCRHHERE